MRFTRLLSAAGFVVIACTLSRGSAQTGQGAKPPLKKSAAAAQIAKSYTLAQQRAVLTLAASSQTAQPNQTLQFTLSWSRPVYREVYVYDWGDGSTPEQRTDLSATHAFASPGTYTVKVAAHLNASPEVAKASTVDSNTVTISVTTPEKPSATLRPDKLNPTAGETAVFEASVRPEVSDAHYSYDFGDGSPVVSGSNRVEHVYNSAGAYEPTVTVLNQGGQPLATSPPVDLRVAAVQVVSPRLNVDVESKGQLIAESLIVVRATLDPPEKSANFLFDWEDGSKPVRVGAGGVAEHRYARPGLYEIVVRAETEQAFDPPLQGHAQVTIDAVPPPSQPPRPTWPKRQIEVVAAALALALAGWMLIPRPKFRYLGSSGISRHEIRMIARTGSAGSSTPFTFNPGLEREEHVMKFRE